MDSHIRFGLEELTPTTDAPSVTDVIERELNKAGGFWKRVAQRVANEDGIAIIKQKIAETDVFGVLAEGWAAARELRDHCDSAKYPDGVPSFVCLGKHRLKAQIHPVVTIALGASAGPRIRFTLAFEALLEAVELAIETRHIVAARPRGCTISAAFQYGEVSLYPMKRLTGVRIPGEIMFDSPGIPIQRVQRRASG